MFEVIFSLPALLPPVSRWGVTQEQKSSPFSILKLFVLVFEENWMMKLNTHGQLGNMTRPNLAAWKPWSAAAASHTWKFYFASSSSTTVYYSLQAAAHLLPNVGAQFTKIYICLLTRSNQNGLPSPQAECHLDMDVLPSVCKLDWETFLVAFHRWTKGNSRSLVPVKT